MIVISALCIWLGSNLKVTNISRKQAAAETIYNALVNFVHDKMGTEFDRYIPLVGTIFITSIVSNLISLLGIWSPTADLMTELGWALVVFVIITYHKIKASGIGGGQQLAFYQPPVDKEQLPRPGTVSRGGTAHKAAGPHIAAAAVHLQQTFGKIPAQGSVDR